MRVDICPGLSSLRNTQRTSWAQRTRWILHATALAVVSFPSMAIGHAKTGSAARNHSPLVAASASQSQAPGLPDLNRVGFDQHPGAQLPLDAWFRDERGTRVTLDRYFRKRPIVLVMTYYECPNLCTIVLNGLVNGLRHVRFDAGEKFDVIALSISPRETAELAASKKAAYVAHYGRAGAADGWHFLTGEEAQIRRVAHSIGFRYFRDQKSGQYAHPAGLVLLTANGRVASYLPGVAFPSAELSAAIVSAANGRVSAIIDRLFLLCFHYDPATGRYSIIVERAVQLAALMTVAALVGLIGILALRERARRRQYTES